MEKLREELERKRKNVAETFGGRKYMKRSEIEQRELHSLREQEHKELSSKKSASSSSSAPPPPYPDAGPHLIDPPALSSRPRPPPSKLLSEEDKIDELVLPKSEVVRRLRMLKHPVTLFGEDDDARLDRLKSLLKAGVSDPDNELMEGQRNDFLKDITQLNKMEKSGGRKEKDSGGLEDGMDRGDLSADGGSSGKDNHDKDAKRMRSDFGSLCNEDKILVFFKRLLQEWEQELEDRPDAEKRSGKGKQMVAIYKQCVRYLTPLFKMCRKRLLPSDICRALMVVVDCCMKRDYLAAMDQYIKLAIGNAPWPIGVTMVGIHERSAREKIYTNSVAHIMNDETTRKYLQSIKRLMTLCQRRYPSAPSKSVEFNSLANGSDLQSLLAEETVRTGNQAVEEQLRLMNAPANNTQSL